MMVTQEDDTIQHYMALNPWRFDEVVSLEIRQSPPQQGQRVGLTVSIILRPSTDSGSDTSRLQLVFHGVDDMRLRAGGYFQLSQIEIVSIRDRRWQDLKYLVHETEVDDMRFYCNRFEARLMAEDSEEIITEDAEE